MRRETENQWPLLAGLARQRVHLRPEQVVPLALFGATLVLTLVAGIIVPGFLRPFHLLNLLRQAVALGILTIGQTLAILSGGVDLSLASVAILTNVVVADLLQGRDANNLFAFAAVTAMGALIGLVNGLGITRLRITPFVMTLGMGIATQGAALVYTQGAARGAASPLLRFIGVGRIMDVVPVGVVLWAVLSALVILMLSRTTFGREIYAVGDNHVAARLSGIRVERVLTKVYVLSALSGVVSGLFMTGYIGTGTLDLGEDYRLTSLAAVVMGGTPFRGGTGGYLGTISGVLALTVLSGLLTVLQVSEPLRQMAYGLIILLVLAAGGRGDR